VTRAATNNGNARMQDVAHSPLTIDPITLEVIRHGVVSIANQIDANIKRTAFSPTSTSITICGRADGCRRAADRAVHGGDAAVVADSVGMAVRDGLCDLRPRPPAYGDVVLCKSRRSARPAPQQHRDVHAIMPGGRRTDRLLRHQCALIDIAGSAALA